MRIGQPKFESFYFKWVQRKSACTMKTRSQNRGVPALSSPSSFLMFTCDFPVLVVLRETTLEADGSVSSHLPVVVLLGMLKETERAHAQSMHSVRKNCKADSY